MRIKYIPCNNGHKGCWKYNKQWPQRIHDNKDNSREFPVTLYITPDPIYIYIT
ncbi:hypothetical protein CLOSBL3_12710 [Clostridiaceae bacterium BL-3]|nr:hypothetical protein CLOSBL3_12710 [Clostridiaceae bacterium BL-3]